LVIRQEALRKARASAAAHRFGVYHFELTSKSSLTSRRKGLRRGGLPPLLTKKCAGADNAGHDPSIGSREQR
jgi:hypothetical protein